MRCAEIRALVVLCLALWLAGCGVAPRTDAPQSPPPGQPSPGATPGAVEPAPAALGPPPLHPQLLADFQQALAAMREGDYGAALPSLEQVIARDASLPGAHVNLGIARLRLGEEKPARAAFARALELEPGHAAAHNQLAILERRAGRFTAAREHYRRALAAHPDYAVGHLNLGILCDLYLRQADCALTHYARYVELAGEQAEAVGLWIVDLQRRVGQ